MQNTTRMSPLIGCNSSYVPTTSEYMEALGSYGTSFLISGGLITAGLYILFFTQVSFTRSNAHKVYRRHIYWIASVYPFMTLMSVISVIVPRAHNICTAAKVTYMSVGISHFTDLTVLMYGSKEVMLARTMGEPLNLRVGPICCCCFCLPKPPVTKIALQLVMMMSDQLPFTQAAYYLTVLILLSASNITLGNVNPTGSFLWLNLFNLASFMSGVYSLQILTYFSKGHLESYSYRKKSFSMRILVLVTNLQSLIFDIMANYDAFPCIPPYLPPQIYKQTVENSVYFVEMMVLGTFTYWQYHNDQFLFPNPFRLIPPTFDTETSSAYSASFGVRSTKSTNSYASNSNGADSSEGNVNGAESPSCSPASSTFYVDEGELEKSEVSGEEPRILVHQNGEERELRILAVHQPITGDQRGSTLHLKDGDNLVISGKDQKVLEAPNNVIIHHPVNNRAKLQKMFSIT